MGGTSWFWNHATPARRRAVASVSLAVSAVWLLVDLGRTPIPGSIAVPAFLILFFGVQWASAHKKIRSDI